MKSRKAAAFLALFLGTFGVHRFYLGQTGLGLAYFFSTFLFKVPVSAIMGVIDAVTFFSMSDEQFDRKYNKGRQQSTRQTSRTSTRTTRRTTRQTTRRSNRDELLSHQKRQRSQDRVNSQRTRKKNVTRRNPFKLSGKKKLTEYDLKGAIDDFKRSIDINPDDPETHYMMASAYSLNEQAEEAFNHLSIAVAQGFKDYEKIKTADELAFLRIHDDFEAFEKAGYRKSNPIDAQNQSQTPDDTLLAQLQRLAEMRKKGLITDEDFEIEKRRIMR